MSTVMPPLRSSLPAADIEGFFRAVSEAFALHVKSVPVPDGVIPALVETFPKERLTKPDRPFSIVTYHVVDGAMSATTNDGKIVPRAPALREKGRSTNKDGYNVITLGWWEDAVIAFTIQANSNQNANQLAVWFHRFLIRYAYIYKFFEARGIQQFRFVKRREDFTELREGQEVYVRTLVYSFRIEYLDTLEERQLTDLTLHTTTGRESETRELSAE